MGFLRTDDDYRALGVEPPEHINHGDMPLPVDNHIHNWIQVGNFMECTASQHPHGHPFDHVNNILVGTSPNGEPIFRTIDLQEPLGNTEK